MLAPVRKHPQSIPARSSVVAPLVRDRSEYSEGRLHCGTQKELLFLIERESEQGLARTSTL